eukprot:COSAG06_NODE_1253_length_10093_cov_37.358515_1_plen_74_part_00
MYDMYDLYDFTMIPLAVSFDLAADCAVLSSGPPLRDSQLLSSHLVTAMPSAAGDNEVSVSHSCAASPRTCALH